MPEIRYQVPGVPSALRSSAFTPVYARPAQNNLAYKYAVTGTQGRVAVPAPTIDTVPSPDAGDLATMGYARSSDAPPAWWPQQWFQGVALERPGAGMPIQVYDPVHPGKTTVIPVPAVPLAPAQRAASAAIARVAILNRVRDLPWYPRRWRTPPAGGAGNSGG